MSTQTFDPSEKERQLRKESTTWATNHAQDAADNDIPILDLSDYLLSGSTEALKLLAEQLRVACEEVGFFSIVGHQVPREQMGRTFEMVRAFHDQAMETKESILMDQANWPVGGVGYLPINNKKLPARNIGNFNEAFLIKKDHKTDFNDNQWPNDDSLPGFKKEVINYALALEKLGKQLLPVFATALEMPEDFFEQAFVAPLYRLRMTHYPAAEPEAKSETFGIAPHVDTTFCTILAQDQAGLTVYSERKQQWINAPLIEDAFIVNSGELLRQWTNDRFLSTKHFASNNVSGRSRYSIPFFLNANADFQMSCIPSCCGPNNPAKYPTISYSQSQAVAQGE